MNAFKFDAVSRRLGLIDVQLIDSTVSRNMFPVNNHPHCSAVGKSQHVSIYHSPYIIDLTCNKYNTTTNNKPKMKLDRSRIR